MPNNYFPGLVLIKPQYSAQDTADKPENVTWWKGGFSAGLTVAQATAILTAFDGAFADVWKIAGVSTANYEGSILTDWSSNTGITHTSVGTFVAVPGDATGLQGNNVAALVSLHGSLRYRGGHGRVYLPAVGNSVLLDPSHLTSATTGGIDTAYTSLAAAMNGVSSADGGPFVQQVFRFRNAAIGAVKPAALVAVNGQTAQELLSSQRRRLRKVPHR